MRQFPLGFAPLIVSRSRVSGSRNWWLRLIYFVYIYLQGPVITQWFVPVGGQGSVWLRTCGWRGCHNSMPYLYGLFARSWLGDPREFGAQHCDVVGCGKVATRD